MNVFVLFICILKTVKNTDNGAESGADTWSLNGVRSGAKYMYIYISGAPHG